MLLLGYTWDQVIAFYTEINSINILIRSGHQSGAHVSINEFPHALRLPSSISSDKLIGKHLCLFDIASVLSHIMIEYIFFHPCE